MQPDRSGLAGRPRARARFVYNRVARTPLLQVAQPAHTAKLAHVHGRLQRLPVLAAVVRLPDRCAHTPLLRRWHPRHRDPNQSLPPTRPTRRSGILRVGMSPKQGRNPPALVENLSPKQGRNTPALVEGQLQNSMSQRLSHPRPSQEWNSDMHGTQSNVTVRCTHTEFPVCCTF